MSPKSSSSSATNPDSEPSPATLEVESARNCVGRVYNFKPCKKGSSDTHHKVHKDWLYQQHPVVVIHRQSDGHVHIVTITSSIDKTIDPRMYMPVSGDHWDTADHSAKVNLVGTETDASEMPKPQSYVRLDSRKQVSFDVLREFHSHSGEHYQLSWESTIKLWDSVMEAERGFASQQELDMEQGEKQISKLRLLQEKIKGLAKEVDECLDQPWLQPQQELERSLFEQEQTLKHAVQEQGYQSQNQANDNPVLEAIKAETVRRVETEIAISKMRGRNSKTGKLTPRQNKELKEFQNLIRDEIRRGQQENKDMGIEVKTKKDKGA
ncbi:hypothetical protein VE02_01180 [Pseudogymnoascus sp. 03VT05]|nr:hypothetical protein VE02_01180 [Pseudogymnoascus sp. 03VT05]